MHGTTNTRHRQVRPSWHVPLLSRAREGIFCLRRGTPVRQSASTSSMGSILPRIAHKSVSYRKRPMFHQLKHY